MMQPPAKDVALITMGVSHFCEKARWALQRYGMPFTEEVHAPGAHRLAVKAAGGRGSVPCLRLPRPPAAAGGAPSSGSAQQQAAPACIDESTPILRWVDEECAAAAAAAGQPPPPPLFPPGAQGAEAARLCHQLDRQMGPAVRVWAYSHLLYTPAIAQAMVAPPVPALERLALRCGGWLLLRRLMAKVGEGRAGLSEGSSVCRINGKERQGTMLFWPRTVLRHVTKWANPSRP